MVNSVSQKVMWINETPSSTFYCRPIKFILKKENAELVREQYRCITEQIKNLECDLFEVNGKIVEVSYSMHCTMVDGAITNILSDTNASSRCFICQAGPKDMTKMGLGKISSTDNYKFGLSTLHCWIRFLECVLHISYRLPFKQWRKTKEAADIFEENKKKIQQEFKMKTGLIIDQVKSKFGTTNDGNTARRFFSTSSVAAEITGVDTQLIENFSIILRVISSAYKINVKTFQKLLTTTRDIYLKQYEWYLMPNTVHKILVHGCDVIEFFDLPIGMYLHVSFVSGHP